VRPHGNAGGARKSSTAKPGGTDNSAVKAKLEDLRANSRGKGLETATQSVSTAGAESTPQEVSARRGASGRRVKFEAGALDAASALGTGRDHSKPTVEAGNVSLSEATPNAWETWRPANAEDMPLRTSAKIPMPMAFPAPTQATADVEEADEGVERTTGMELYADQKVPPAGAETRSQVSLRVDDPTFDDPTLNEPMVDEFDEALQTNDRGSLVHRMSHSLFFAPIKPTVNAPTVPEMPMDELTS
jgi:hypothetical protein